MTTKEKKYGIIGAVAAVAFIWLIIWLADEVPTERGLPLAISFAFSGVMAALGFVIGNLMAIK